MDFQNTYLIDRNVHMKSLQFRFQLLKKYTIVKKRIHILISIFDLKYYNEYFLSQY